MWKKCKEIYEKQIKNDLCSKGCVRGNNYCVSVSVMGTDGKAVGSKLVLLAGCPGW